MIRTTTVLPNQISNLFFHYDSSDYVNSSLSGGTLIPTIIDKINGNNFTQANTTAHYSLEYNSQNGYPSIVKPNTNLPYSSVTNTLENSWSGNVTMFISCRFPVITILNAFITSGVFNLGTTGGFELIVSQTQLFYRELLNLTTYGSPSLNYNTGKTNSITININRGSQSFFAVNNNRVIMSNNTPAYNQSIYDNIYIGASPIASATVPQGLRLNEILIYNRSLSFQEEKQINRYLKFKWGI